MSARFSWAKRRLGEGARGLSLAPRGAIRLGDYLVDDRGTNDVNELADEFILFGSEAYPDWDAVVAYLEARRREYLGPAGEAGPAETGAAGRSAQAVGVELPSDHRVQVVRRYVRFQAARHLGGRGGPYSPAPPARHRSRVSRIRKVGLMWSRACRRVCA